jgi:hypothetical protein
VRRTGTAACAIAVALVAARAGAETPPFAPADDDATKVLKLVAWLGSLGDVSAAADTLPGALGLRATPKVGYFEKDGKQLKVSTDYLSDAPIWPESTSKINYTVFEPVADSSWRARIIIEPHGEAVCIKMADMVSRFGKPTDSSMLSDGAGEDFIWTLQKKPWATQVSAYFGVQNQGCTSQLFITEYRLPADDKCPAAPRRRCVSP